MQSVDIQKKMLKLFQKSPVKQLEKKYQKLMEESFKLSTVDRRQSDLKRAEAEEIGKQIDLLRQGK